MPHRILAPLALSLAGIVHAAEPPPIARDLPGEVMPDRGWDFVALHLDLALDPTTGEIAGTAKHTIAPLGRPDTWVRVHQAGLAIGAVRVDGAEVRGWRLGNDTLDVPLPAGGGERVLEIDYRARPQTGLHYRGAKGSADPIVEVWSQGEGEDNRHWFPGWDYPNDRFTYSATLTVPSRYHAASNGALVGKEEVGDGLTRWSYALDRAIPGYLVAVVVGEYDVYADDGPVPHEYLVPRGVSEADARRTFEVAKPQMVYFAELLGEPYPYDIYRQVLVERFLYGAMENATLVTFDQRFLRHDDVVRGRGTESVVAHELAHHWFGDLLTCYGWRELWLNEGFASFYADRWLEHAYGPEVGAVEVREAFEAARHDPYPLAPLAWSKDGRRTSGSVYTRGEAVLQMARVHLGEDVFDRGIRRYVAGHKDTFVESTQLRRALEEEGGAHLGWLFDQYVNGPGVPKMSTSWAWKGGATTVKLAQEGDAFHVPVEVEIGTTTETLVRRVWAGPGAVELVVDTKEPPLWVAVDPRCGVLAAWDAKQPTAAWIAQLGSAEACARLDAIAQLGAGEGTAEAVAALAREAGNPNHAPEYRVEAVEALGQLGDASGPLLAALAADPEIRVQAAALTALGTLPASPERVALLERATRSGDAWLRARALRALADLDAAAGVKAARAALKGAADERGWIHDAALEVLGDRGEASDLAAVLAKAGPEQLANVRQAAARASARVFARLDASDREKRRESVARALDPLLEDPDLRCRELGVYLLGSVGDDTSEAKLRALGRSSTLPPLREAALDAASRIRGRGYDTLEAEATPSDLERLDEELDALEKRLKRLEDWR